MNSEEIIERLLEEKKITVKEAITLIKDVNKFDIYTNEFVRTNLGDFPKTNNPWTKSKPFYPITEPVMCTTTHPNSKEISKVDFSSIKVDNNINKN